MASRYLLDTNILSDLLRHPKGPVARRIEIVGEGNVCTSVIVAAELRFGVAKSGSREVAKWIGNLLNAIDILPLEESAAEVYGQLRQALARRGQLIGPNDMLIAAHALAADLTLVTANVKEFSHVQDLRVDNWLANRA